MATSDRLEKTLSRRPVAGGMRQRSEKYVERAARKLTTVAVLEVAMVTGIDVHLYNVKDFDRALGFYRGLLGQEPTTTMPGAWAEFELPDGSAFAIGKHENYPWQAGYNVMFSVPDVPAAIELVRSLGGQAADPGESPVCFMSFAQDSEGNEFVLHRRK